MVTWAPHSQRSSAMSLVEVLFYPPSTSKSIESENRPWNPNTETSFMRRSVGANDHGLLASCGWKTKRFWVRFWVTCSVEGHVVTMENITRTQTLMLKVMIYFRSLPEIGVFFNLSIFEFLQHHTFARSFAPDLRTSSHSCRRRNGTCHLWK